MTSSTCRLCAASFSTVHQIFSILTAISQPLRFCSSVTRLRQIAKELVLSEHTVENHVRNTLKKPGVQSRVQIAAWWQNRDRFRRQSGTLNLPASSA